MPSYSLQIPSLADAYAEGHLTPSGVARDVVAAAVEAQENPVWIHLVPAEEVLTRAREIESRRAGGEALPLYGVPFAVKDNIDVAGHPTTAGCPAFSYRPAETAAAVARLQDAGGLLIGKTNLDQFATGLTGTRSPYGACFNPFNSSYIAGGSSSGSAVAVASGLVSFALGTDTAGSGRVPAGYNNIVGLKPTRGLVSTRGVVPACRSLDCVSIFALTGDDAAAVLDAARGYDAGDIYSREDAGDEIPAAAQPVRCGIPAASQLEFFGDATARAAFDGARARLAEIGTRAVETDFAPFAEAARLLYDGPWVAERYAAVGSFVREHPQSVDPVVRGIIEGAARWNAVDAFQGAYRLRELKRRCDEAWKSVDVMFVPTAGTIYRLDEIAAAPVERNTHLGYYTNFVNLLDLCALAVPGPFRADGLPAGVTLIAPAKRESLVLSLGARFQRALRIAPGAPQP